MRRYIIIRTNFDAIHCWPDCPIKEVSFLRNPHRHIFYITMKWEVNHSNRDIEFIKAKQEVDEFVQRNWRGQDLGSSSCEQLGDMLKHAFPEVAFISVFEDNENGMEVVYE